MSTDTYSIFLPHSSGYADIECNLFSHTIKGLTIGERTNDANKPFIHHQFNANAAYLNTRHKDTLLPKQAFHATVVGITMLSEALHQHDVQTELLLQGKYGMTRDINDITKQSQRSVWMLSNTDEANTRHVLARLNKQLASFQPKEMTSELLPVCDLALA